ncbi:MULTISPECIES: hypothetical protein [Cupriavidus]
MSEVISEVALDAAIHRCIAAHPPEGHALAADARQPAEHYGEYIDGSAQTIDLTQFPRQASIVRKWLA